MSLYLDTRNTETGLLAVEGDPLQGAGKPLDRAICEAALFHGGSRFRHLRL